MPMLMDVYTRGDTLALRYATHAHAATVKLQGGHDVHYLRYWVDEARGKVFCLVDAPDATRSRRGSPQGLQPARQGDLHRPHPPSAVRHGGDLPRAGRRM